MGRRKIEIKAIKDDRNRSVTFLKRKGGLFKKAHELSVLCSVDVAVIIFGHNKKLYEFSSGDMTEIISRYNYYGVPHEHKGPADFAGKKDMLDDDDDDIDMPSPHGGSHSSQDRSLGHPIMQGHPGLPHPHINSRQPTASASPPIQNRNLMGPAAVYPPQSRSTPQPISRPDSRNTRRISNPVLNHTATQNGYAYMPVPSVYQPPVSQSVTMQPTLNPIANYQYSQAPQHLQAQNQQQYIQEQNRRTSVAPPAYPPRTEAAEAAPVVSAPAAQAHIIESRKGSKSRSMYTPIAQESSSLAMHWGMGQSTHEPASIRSHSVDTGSIARKPGATVTIEKSSTLPGSKSRSPPRPASISTTVTDFMPPSRTNSSNVGTPGARPKLNIRIPSEPSDAGSATAESSPRGSGTTGDIKSAQGTATDGSHSGVVLPPPSPSASALLSAGATGPANPFARPAPTAGPGETPISALPSRFAEGLFPSPSTFYPEWGFSRGGNNGGVDTLPSPLNFQTPVLGGPSQNIFKDYRDEDLSAKRKSPGSDHSDGSASKRIKA